MSKPSCITEQDIREVIRLHHEGVSMRGITRVMGKFHHSTIIRIIQRYDTDRLWNLKRAHHRISNRLESHTSMTQQ